MDYANNALGAKNAYAKALGGLSSGIGLQNQAAKLRTISSAIGRIDDLNGRLRDINGRLQGIADQIGGPRPVAGISGEKLPEPQGVVGQLNDSAERAHSQLNDIEELLATIGRALG